MIEDEHADGWLRYYARYGLRTAVNRTVRGWHLTIAHSEFSARSQPASG